MLSALLNTHLFDLVKAVELITGLAVLFGFFTPLALLANVLLCVAYIASLRPMFAVRAKVANTGQALKQLAPAARVIFGAWLLANGANHFFFSLWPTPAGHEPLSTQLMSALVSSHLLDVCMLIELVAGALILLGYFVPAALCTVMAVSTCALFWAILDHQPLTLALGVIAFSLNGLLMLACLPYYKGVFQRAPLW